VSLPTAGAAARAATDEPVTQRARILRVALELMGERGVAGTPMRLLADSCGLNVATLYHYFPSKADLVRSLVAERQYRERLRVQPQVAADLPARERYAALVRLIWDGAGEEVSLWRVFIGESVHGDEAVREAVADVFDALRTGLEAWIAELFPDLPGSGPRSVTSAARLTESLLIAAVVELLALGSGDPFEQAAMVADLLFDADAR
jgi:AcrR family transcriptional regulator